MARNVGQIIQNNFSNGLITEATGLNFPENSAIEAWDCIFDRRGRVTRRLGFSYEAGFEVQDQESTTGVKSEFVWKSAGSNGATVFVVIQEGTIISFYIPDSNGIISPNKKAFTVDLTAYKTSSASSSEIEVRRADMASGHGKLFINHPFCEPIYVEYDEDTDTITTTAYEILIRDMSGIVDETALGERPTTLTLKHKYNLYNQGWFISVQCGKGKNNLEDLGIHNVLTFWDEHRDNFPSNSDVWWLYKDTADRFNYRIFDTVAVGNSPAPKGHYIDNAFFFDRASVSGVASLPDPVKTSGKVRPSCVAFFAGRVWYSGVNTDDYVGKVYYTQVIENEGNIGLCYQRNDPTDENLSDLLDTDGGVVDLLEATNIIRMVPIQNYLFIFCENGIWVISGSQGAGFVATDYSISKLSDIPCISAYNFVLVDGYPMWWNHEGIYSISLEQSSFVPKLITEDKIKTFFQEILTDNVNYAKGVYTASAKTIHWLYRSSSASTFEENFQYDRVLVLDLNSGAFYPWRISEGVPKVCGILSLDTRGVTVVSEGVTVDGEAVEVDGETVVLDANELGGSVIIAPTIYIVTGDLDSATDKICFATTSNTNYVDWEDETEVPYTSEFITGPMIHAEGDKDFSVEYLTFFSDTQANSSFFVQASWDWTNSADSGKWSNVQQGYSTKRTNRDVSRKRLIIRGFGPSLQLRFSSEDGKPFNILGWSSAESANAKT